MTAKIIQITDLHLFAERGGTLAGMATWDTFEAVLSMIDERDGDADRIVITGDIAQDEAPQTYVLLREALGAWAGRSLLIPGNHDNRAGLLAAFPEIMPNAGRITFDVRVDGWRLLGLDSQVTGAAHGALDGAQRAWLERALSQAPAVPVAVFVHHPPIAIAVPWMDRQGMRGGDDFVHLVKARPQIKVICAGHVHQSFSGALAGAFMYTTPSTCVQFGATTEFSFDNTKTPGYRVLALGDDGRCQTQVRRLPTTGQ